MKRFRGLFLILCLSCMLLVSACSTAPHVSGPVRMALALEEESELLVLEAPTPTAEPPEPTPEPAAETKLLPALRLPQMLPAPLRSRPPNPR